MDVLAYCNTATAEDALAVVTDKVWGAVVDGIFIGDTLEAMCITAEFHCKVLKFALVVSHAVETVFFVVGKDEFHCCLSAFHDFVGVCVHFHAFVDRIDACCTKSSCALDFNKTNTASADCVDALEIAKSGDFDAGYFCGFEDC